MLSALVEYYDIIKTYAILLPFRLGKLKKVQIFFHENQEGNNDTGGLINS
jgi:hypothetical protein